MGAVAVCFRQGGLQGKLARQPRIFVVAEVSLDRRALRLRGPSAHYTPINLYPHTSNVHSYWRKSVCGSLIQHLNLRYSYRCRPQVGFEALECLTCSERRCYTDGELLAMRTIRQAAEDSSRDPSVEFELRDGTEA